MIFYYNTNLNITKIQHLFQRLHEVQSWIKNVSQQTHKEFFALPEKSMMAQYFLNRLYGGPDF